MIFRNYNILSLYLLFCLFSFMPNESLSSKITINHSEENQLDFIPLNVTNIITEFFTKNILTENSVGVGKFLEISEEKIRKLKISDFTLNALFYLVERAVKLDIRAKNDSSNPLPISIDSDSLSIIVNELKKYEQNVPMSLRIYHDINKHPTPKVITDPEGSLLNAYFGMEFGIFAQDTTEPTTILNIDVSIRLKYQLETTANKFSFGMKYVSIKDIVINYDELNVNTEKLKVSLTNFIKVAYDSVDEKITDVDILKILNDFIKSDFTIFDIFMDYGYFMIMIG